MFTKNYNVQVLWTMFGTVDSAQVAQCVSWDGIMAGDSKYPYSLGYNGGSLVSLMTELRTNVYNGWTYTSTAYNGVVFGTGNVAPTIDDYKLSGELVTGLNTSNVTFVTTDTYENGRRTRTVVYTISNTADADITIGEVGLVGFIRGASSSSSSYTYNNQVLLERTALEEPVTIPAGGVGRVTYSITVEDPIT